MTFRLIPDELSDDAVECLTELLGDAKAGRILGLAFVAMYKGRRYIVNTAGECRRNRTFTRGMLADLQDTLGATIEAGHPRRT